jgi:murein DD-endopeptidase MepM/ murein hydrolase activator NlpD
VTSLYAHLQIRSIQVSVGDRVRVGDTVGLVGATGIATAPHLHFELQVRGSTVNPAAWLAARGAQ